VVEPPRIDGYRAPQVTWNKWCGIPTQPVEKTQSTRFSQSTRFAHGLGPARGAGPGMPFSRTATQCQVTWGAPFGRGVKQPCPKHSLQPKHSLRLGWAPLMGQALRFVAPFDKDRAIACKARRATDRFTSRCIHQTLIVRPLVRFQRNILENTGVSRASRDSHRASESVRARLESRDMRRARNRPRGRHGYRHRVKCRPGCNLS
jgi:hypothetical protein